MPNKPKQQNIKRTVYHKEKDIQNLISQARTEFVLKEPFLGDLSLRLVPKETDEIHLMGTDGTFLLYNPKLLIYEQYHHIKGIIAHEISHCMCQHVGKLRRGIGFVLDVWLIACEYMVNSIVTDMLNLRLPDDAYYHRKYSNGEWTTEAIYYDLLKNAKFINMPACYGCMQMDGQSKKQKKCGNSQCNGHIILDDHSMWDKAGQGEDTKSADTNTQWKVFVANAMHHAKRQGKLPAGLERIIGEVLEAKLPWQQILAEFVMKRAKDDFSWKRPNKRHLYRNIIAPSLDSEKLNIAYAMDTSGSMGPDELAEGFGELKGILSAVSSYTIHLFACDAAVHHYQELTAADTIDMEGLCKGGGGTSFIPVFDKISHDDISIDALIYFTDAYGTFPDAPPDYPVLWVVKGNGEVPFGKRCEL